MDNKMIYVFDNGKFSDNFFTFLKEENNFFFYFFQTYTYIYLYIYFFSLSFSLFNTIITVILKFM